jgi:hypothetical protein
MLDQLLVGHGLCLNGVDVFAYLRGLLAEGVHPILAGLSSGFAIVFGPRHGGKIPVFAG